LHIQFTGQQEAAVQSFRQFSNRLATKLSIIRDYSQMMKYFLGVFFSHFFPFFHHTV